jgi:hypothetical protein
MFEAMAEVQQLSIAAIQATTFPNASKTKPIVSTVLGCQGDTTNEVLFKHANVAMIKLNGIRKSNDEKKG